MRSMPSRPLAAAVLIALAVALEACSASGSGAKPAAPNAVEHIQVKGGRPVGGVAKITVKKGEPVHFTVTSDVADEVHLHGYDLHKNLPSGGGTVRFDFPAKIDGAFVIELEKRSQQIGELTVLP